MGPQIRSITNRCQQVLVVSLSWLFQRLALENTRFLVSESGLEMGGFPILPLFLEKARKTTKNQGFSITTEPLKSLQKKGKTLKKARKASQGKTKKKQGIPQKSKERKDKVLVGKGDASKRAIF